MGKIIHICVLGREGRLELLPDGRRVVFCGHWIHWKGKALVFEEIFLEGNMCYIYIPDVPGKELMSVSLFECEEKVLILNPGVSCIEFCKHHVSWDGKNIIFINRDYPDDLSRRIEIIH